MVGVSRRTPKWQARPKPFWWMMPFPSTRITSGHRSGLFSLSFSNRGSRLGISLKARNPGTYGRSSSTYSQCSQTIFNDFLSSITSAEQAMFSWSIEKLISTPATYFSESWSHLKSSFSNSWFLKKICSLFQMSCVAGSICLRSYLNLLSWGTVEVSFSFSFSICLLQIQSGQYFNRLLSQRMGYCFGSLGLPDDEELVGHQHWLLVGDSCVEDFEGFLLDFLHFFGGVQLECLSEAGEVVHQI